MPLVCRPDRSVSIPGAPLLIRSVSVHDAGDEHAPALDLAPTPTSLLAPALADQIEPAAAALVAGQQADGGWAPFWDWAFVDEAAAVPDVTIVNTGSVEYHARQLVRIIKGERWDD